MPHESFPASNAADAREQELTKELSIAEYNHYIDLASEELQAKVDEDRNSLNYYSGAISRLGAGLDTQGAPQSAIDQTVKGMTEARDKLLKDDKKLVLEAMQGLRGSDEGLQVSPDELFELRSRTARENYQDVDHLAGKAVRDNESYMGIAARVEDGSINNLVDVARKEYGSQALELAALREELHTSIMDQPDTIREEIARMEAAKQKQSAEKAALPPMPDIES